MRLFKARLLHKHRLSVLLMLIGFGVAGCGPSPVEQRPAAANDKLQAEIATLRTNLDDTQKQLHSALADAARAQQEYAACQRLQQEQANAEEQRRSKQPGVNRPGDEQPSGFMDRLGNGDMTTAELQAVLPVHSSQERVKQLLGAPNDKQNTQWMYWRWQVHDSSIQGKTYAGFSVLFGNDGTVSELAFWDMD